MALCYVARGYIDCYTTDNLKPWDIAAGSLIVTEAGGCVTLVDGAPFDSIHGSISASCNDTINREAVALVRAADATPLNIN